MLKYCKMIWTVLEWANRMDQNWQNIALIIYNKNVHAYPTLILSSLPLFSLPAIMTNSPNPKSNIPPPHIEELHFPAPQKNTSGRHEYFSVRLVSPQNGGAPLVKPPTKAEEIPRTRRARYGRRLHKYMMARLDLAHPFEYWRKFDGRHVRRPV